MEKSSKFRIRNVIALIRIDLTLNKPFIIVSTAAAVITLLVLNLIAGQSPEEQNYYTFYGFIFLFLGGNILVTGVLYRDMHRADKRTRYVTLPASQLEKLVSRYFLSLIGYFICAAGFYIIYMPISEGFNSFIYSQPIPRDTDLFSSFGTVFSYFIILHSLFFLGSIYFTEYTVFKTVISVSVIAGLLYNFEWLIYSITYGSYEIFHLKELNLLSRNMPLQTQLHMATQHLPIILIVLAVFCLIIAFVRFKEIEG